MAKNPKIDALRRVPLFEHCSTRELSKIAKTVDEIDLPEGRTLTHEGMYGREFVVLAQGIADVEVYPVAHRVLVAPRARVRELPRLDVDRHAREQPVASAVIEVQVRIDHADDLARHVL